MTGTTPVAGGVLVVGEALIDIVMADPAVHPVEHVGGSPANVALGLGRLGRSVRLHTALAHDHRGARIAAHLEESGVRIADESWSLSRTSTAAARIQADGSARYDFQVDWPSQAVSLNQNDRLLHVGSIAALAGEGAADVADAVASASGRIPVSFDPNIRPALVGTRNEVCDTVEWYVTRADIVKLSDEDAAWLYPGLAPSAVLAHFLSLGARVAAITLGAEGSLLRSDRAEVAVPAPRVVVRDTVGAGDSFSAALIDALVERPELLTTPDEPSLRHLGAYAAHVASLTVQRTGADLPARADLGSTP